MGYQELAPVVLMHSSYHNNLSDEQVIPKSFHSTHAILCVCIKFKGTAAKLQLIKNCSIGGYKNLIDPLHNAKRYTGIHVFMHKEQLSSNHLPPLTPVRALFDPSEGAF